MSDDSDAAYYLRSCESSCPDIPLVPGVRLGRGALTRITDTRVSRTHIEVTRTHSEVTGVVSRTHVEVTEAGDTGVTITQRGPNHSVVSGQELRRGESVTITPGIALLCIIC